MTALMIALNKQLDALLISETCLLGLLKIAIRYEPTEVASIRAEIYCNAIEISNVRMAMNAAET